MSSADDPSVAGSRAVATFEAIRTSRLYSKRRHLFGRRRWLFWRSYEHLWPFADAWSALCTLSSVEAFHPRASDVLDTMFEGLVAYHDQGDIALGGTGPVAFQSSVVPPRGPGGDVYYDDNAWVGLALMRHEELTGDQRALSVARRLCAFVTSGWSSDPAWSHPGGIRWKEPVSNRSRNTCSNGPTAELAALVHERTGDPDAREWSVRIYDWVRSALLGTDDLYADQISPDGTIDPTRWSYNQGSMIGAGVLLHRVTHDDDYLAEARATATALLRRFSSDDLLRQDAAFNAVFFRNLFLLDQVSPDPTYRAACVAYGDAVWDQRRDTRTGLFGGGTSFLNDSAPVMELYALLAGAQPHP